MKVQFGLVAIRLFNIIYVLLIWVPLRRFLLRMVGCSIGSRTGLHDGVRFTWPGRLALGDYSTINLGCFIDTRGGLTIGPNTMIGHFCAIYTMTHDIESEAFASVKKAVAIGRDVVIFPRCMVMPGVCIGDGAVVYPGSLVSHDVGPGEIVAGIPAKVVGRRAGPVRYRLAYSYSLANA